MTWLANTASAVFWGVVLLSILVFVHEAGHYLSARTFGMRVTEFFLGMPCRFRLSRTSRTRGTEIGVTPILLGGYNRICGMEGEEGPHAAEVLACVASHGRVSVGEVAREVGVSEDEALADLAVLSDWASVRPYYDPKLGERPTQKSWPAAFETVRRDANLLTAFDKGHDFTLEGSTEAGEPHALPEGGAEALLAAERANTYRGKGFVARLVTLFAGPLVNVVVGLVLIALTVSVGGITVARDIPVVGSVSAGSLAEQAGIQAGDEVTSVAGTQVSTWTDMGTQLRDAIASGQAFDVTCERDGTDFTVTVDPASDESGSGLFGVTASTEVFHPSIVQSMGVAWRSVTMTAGYVAQLLQPAHTGEVVSQSTSVMGISVMASEAAKSGPVDFLYLMAALSLSLGFMNLLPIPPLDGGKIAIELVQLVSRRRIPERIQVGLSYAGLALTLLLFAFVLRQDILRFVIGG